MYYEITDFISLIRESAPRLQIQIFSFGGCYQFHLILKKMFPEAIPYSDQSHVTSKIGGCYFDINGDVTEIVESSLNFSELKDAPYWGKRFYLSDEFNLVPTR